MPSANLGTSSTETLAGFPSKPAILKELEPRPAATLHLAQALVELIHRAIELLLLDVRLSCRELELGIGIDRQPHALCHLTELVPRVHRAAHDVIEAVRSAGRHGGDLEPERHGL